MILSSFFISLFDFFHHEGFENVAFLDIVEFFKSDTAFEALRDLLDVILEAAERSDLIFKNNDAVTKHADARVTGDLTVADVRACDNADEKAFL